MRRILTLTIGALGLLLLAATPSALAQAPGPDPFAPADPERRPVGMARLSGVPGGPLSFPIVALSTGVQHEAGGAGGGGGAGRTTFDQVAVVKVIDATTARLWQVIAEGRQLPRVEIALCAPGVGCDFVNDGMGGPSPNAYMVYTLEDVAVAALATGGTPGRALGERDAFAGALAERVSFAFTKLTVRPEGAPAVCWEISQNRTC